MKKSAFLIKTIGLALIAAGMMRDLVDGLILFSGLFLFCLAGEELKK